MEIDVTITKQNYLKKIVRRFDLQGEFVAGRPYGKGHINDTFLITLNRTGKRKFLLQRINHNVFKDVPGLMNNIKIVTNHILYKIKQNGRSSFLPDCYTFIPAKEGVLYYKDKLGNYWRLMYFVENSITYEQNDLPERAYNQGRAYGEFLELLDDLYTDKLIETIPRFHNIEWRLKQFDQAVQNNRVNRLNKIETEMQFVKKRAAKMHKIGRFDSDSTIPLRITHNDTKLNNILFGGGDQVLGVIDLDTVMPGYVHYDFGDAIRTGASTAQEDEVDLNKVMIDMELFKSFSEGYLHSAGHILTKAEFQSLPISGNLMTFIMGLRFLTDYLRGDLYFKTQTADHNLHRARAQFKLLESMEARSEEMKAVILTMAGTVDRL